MPGTRWRIECQKKIQLIPEPVCDICGLPQARAGMCVRCQKDTLAFKMLRSWTAFENPARYALHRLKYRRDIGLGEMLAEQMSGFVRKLSWPVDTILPIPLGKQRLKERGYNQVAMVALPLSLQLGMTYSPDALWRSRETRSQEGLSALERQVNVKNAFQANARKINGCAILLMDDVSTTGATLSSSADALYESGAREVYAITIARALPHHGLKIA